MAFSIQKICFYTPGNPYLSHYIGFVSDEPEFYKEMEEHFWFCSKVLKVIHFDFEVVGIGIQRECKLDVTGDKRFNFEWRGKTRKNLTYQSVIELVIKAFKARKASAPFILTEL